MTSAAALQCLRHRQPALPRSLLSITATCSQNSGRERHGPQQRRPPPPFQSPRDRGRHPAAAVAAAAQRRPVTVAAAPLRLCDHYRPRSLPPPVTPAPSAVAVSP